MSEAIKKTGERVVPEKFESKEEYLIYLRHIFAYEFAKKIISKKSSVLEVGSGNGYGTSRLSKNITDIIGIDIDKNAIEYSTKKYGSKSCIFKKYDGVKIPHKDNTFDAVISFQVIEHIENDENYVSEIQRVLKDNGIFLLTTPNKSLRLKPNQKPFNRFHIREYYSSELENILRTKFSSVEIFGVCGNAEIQQIEILRIKKSLNIISLDFLNLKRVMLESIKLPIIRIIKRITCKSSTNKDKEKFLNKYNLDDFYITEKDFEKSLDLMGICRK